MEREQAERLLDLRGVSPSDRHRKQVVDEATRLSADERLVLWRYDQLRADALVADAVQELSGGISRLTTCMERLAARPVSKLPNMRPKALGSIIGLGAFMGGAVGGFAAELLGLRPPI